MSVNKVILVGNVGKDPVIRYPAADVAVATFTLATTERGYTLQNGTKVPDRTEWHNIVLWRGLAQTCEKVGVKKGDKLYIEGKIHSRFYDDQRGVRHYVTEIYADTMELMSGRQLPSAPQPQNVDGGASVAPEHEEDPLPF